jgi:hypothetical protein
MKINVIATGSAGNLYEIIDNLGNSLIIEAGMPRATLMKYREGNKPPEMCIVTHKHGDHAKYIGEYTAVIPTYLRPERVQSQNFKVMGFAMKHGNEICFSFLIKVLSENRFLFFGTDFELRENYPLEYSSLFQALDFYRVDIYLIECNYNDYLYHLANEEQRVGCDRHLSDNDVVSFLRYAKARSPKIITIHGSSRLSADSYTKKVISAKISGSIVSCATGVKGGQKNLYII